MRNIDNTKIANDNSHCALFVFDYAQRLYYYKYGIKECCGFKRDDLDIFFNGTETDIQRLYKQPNYKKYFDNNEEIKSKIDNFFSQIQNNQQIQFIKCVLNVHADKNRIISNLLEYNNVEYFLQKAKTCNLPLYFENLSCYRGNICYKYTDIEFNGYKLSIPETINIEDKIISMFDEKNKFAYACNKDDKTPHKVTNLNYSHNTYGRKHETFCYNKIVNQAFKEISKDDKNVLINNNPVKKIEFNKQNNFNDVE